MTVHVLPDREKRHLLQFYVAPMMDYPVRITIAGALILIGLSIQLLSDLQSAVPVLVLSLPFVLVGNLYLLVRGYDTRPGVLGGKKEWVKTTRDRFPAVKELEKQSRRWDETLVDITCYTGLFSLLLLVAAGLFIFFVLAEKLHGLVWAQVFAADAAVLVLPHWITGTRRGWRPVELRQHIGALEPVLQAIDSHKEPPCQVQCMFEMAGEEKEKTPVGARVFVRFPEGPEDFLGVQFQVSLNDVQGTKYPYLYAVIVAKKSFGLHETPIKKVRKAASGKDLRVE